MALFQQTTTTLTQAQAQIADSAGVSADGEMLTRAGRAYEAAIKHWNNIASWNALRVEYPGISVIAPFTVSGCAFTSGSNVVTTTVASGFTVAGVSVWDMISGSGAVLDLTVSALASAAATALTATRSASATLTGVTLTFTRDLYDLPTDFKQVYTARLLGQNRNLSFIGRRHYDRAVADQGSAASPVAYDLFRVGDVGKIRLLPPPLRGDTLKLRYYRRMSTTATPIDVHDDWEPYFIAFAKWWFLNDKGGNEDRAAKWLSFSNEGMAKMLRENVVIQDEDLMFLPGDMAYAGRFSLNPITPAEWP